MLNFLVVLAALFQYSLGELNLERIPSTNPPPIRRLYHFMDYNPVTDQLIIFGGSTTADLVYNDVWAFNITEEQYHHLDPTNEISPSNTYLAPRIGSGGFIDSISNTLYVFGGKTGRGPVNDMWKFDLLTLKWHQIEFSGDNPPAMSFFGYHKVVEDDDLMFYVYGGTSILDKIDQTWVYYLRNNTWEDLTYIKIGDFQRPYKVEGPCIAVYGNYLYLAGGDNSAADYTPKPTLKQNLETFEWENLNIDQDKSYSRRLYSGCLLKDDMFYLVYGWDNTIANDSDSIYTLNLSNPIEWKKVETTNCKARDSFSYALVSDKNFYMFGGFTDYDSTNELLIFNIESLSCSSVNGLYFSPPARMYHSMVTINTGIYIYGGESISEKLEDLWKYDNVTQKWKLEKVIGNSPGKRSSHAYGSQGDMMIIWGGYTELGYSNDMFTFDVISSSWNQIFPTGTLPSSRRGSCLVVNLPLLYIFGGETSTGITNELWKYDSGKNTYTQIEYKSDEVPEPVKYPSCDLIEDKIFVSLGATIGEEPVCTVYSFDIIKENWKLETKLNDYIYCRTLAAVKMMNSNNLVVIGGEVWGTDAYKTAQVMSFNPKIVDSFEIDNYYYGGPSVFLGSKIYMFGGGTLIGNTVRLSIPSYNFYLFDLKQFEIAEVQICSTGTYWDDDQCKLCMQGSYSDGRNMTSCEKCDSGKFNSNDGANSETQCYPCPSGTYSSRNGSVLCNSCPGGYKCSVGSTTYYSYDIVSYQTSNQPASYKPDTAGLDKKKYILYGITFGLMLIFFIVSILNKRVKEFLRVLDIYKSNHYFMIGEFKTLKKNRFGGFASIVFAMLAIILIVSAVLDYEYNNVNENKALLPLVILQNTVDNFYGNISTEITFIDYGGECSNETDENPIIAFSNLEYSSFSVKMEKSGKDCKILLDLKQCEIETGAKINLKIPSYTSFCSSIGLDVNSTSSIEDKYSQVSEIVNSGDNVVFRGFKPSQFYIKAVPSLYQPEYNSEDYTGYHVSINSLATPGSTYTINDLSFSSELSVQVNFIRSSNGLYIKRYYKRTILLLFGSLIGSVFGIMGAVGAAMKINEGNIQRTALMITSNGKLKKLKKRNVHLKDATGVFN